MASKRGDEASSKATGEDQTGKGPPEQGSTDEELTPILERAADEPPGITQLAGLRRPISISATMQVGIFSLMLLAFLYFAKQLMLPVVLAILLNFLLSPFARWAGRFRIPRPVSALVLTGSLTLLVVGMVYLLGRPASQFVQDARLQIDELETKLKGVSDPIEEVKETARQVEEAAADSDVDVVEVRGPGLLGTLMGYAQSFGATLLATGILLMFLISSDEIFLHKLVKILPTFHDKRLAVEIFRQIERDISYYLLTISTINACLGAAAALLLWLVNVPNPLMWGVIVGLLNFIPYLGPGFAMILLGLVGLISFDSIWACAVPPLIVLGLNIVEANAITPLVIGKRLNLNPVLIFLALAFWGFLWGIPGMLLAVPILVTLKSICDHIAPLAPIGEFLTAETSIEPENSNSTG